MHRAVAKLCAFILCLAAFAHSASPPGVWLDVPFIKQEKDGCGAASIAMVMQYWSQKKNLALSEAADPRRIQQALYSKDAKGIYASAMQRYFEEAGFRTFAFKAEWADLEEHLSKGRPLIVSLRSSGWGKTLHYVVVAGLDREQGIVLLNDPAQGKLVRTDRSQFEKKWTAAGNWALLALPAASE